MEFHETFNVIFSYQHLTYAGKIHVLHAPGFYYYCLFMEGKQFLFFVDDEQDEWIENAEGNTRLANIIGDCIDRHYHPDRFRNNASIDPE